MNIIFEVMCPKSNGPCISIPLPTTFMNVGFTGMPLPATFI